MFGYILGGILLYFVFRFITGFVWPVYKATSSMKKQFENMRSQMAQEDNGLNGQPSRSGIDEKPKFDLGGDYIPFEEVKEK
jgi:hypothetical protein